MHQPRIDANRLLECFDGRAGSVELLAAIGEHQPMDGCRRKVVSSSRNGIASLCSRFCKQDVATIFGAKAGVRHRDGGERLPRT